MDLAQLKNLLPRLAQRASRSRCRDRRRQRRTGTRRDEVLISVSGSARTISNSFFAGIVNAPGRATDA